MIEGKANKVANLNANEAFKFELFETVIVPKELPVEKREPVKLREYKKEDVQERIEETARAIGKNNKIFKVAVIAIVTFTCLAVLLFSQAQISIISLQTQAAAAALEEANSEQIRINTALAQKVPMNEVEKYAVEKLGMVKGSRSQIIYVDMNKVAEALKTIKTE